MLEDAHTFIFTDLIGFTTLTAEQGDDRAADVALELRERVGRLLPDHGAEEIKAIGDGLMLRARDPERGIVLGLRIVDELEAVPGFPPVRVGIHTGPAVSRASDWYGNTVNVAARLCAAAGGGEVLASEVVVEAAGRMRGVALGEQRLHWLKNITEPVSARSVRAHECFHAWGRLARLLSPAARARAQEVAS
jgi:adenylate cyclase